MSAVIWNGTMPTALGGLGGTFSSANGINDAGQIVGTSNTTGDATNQPVIWKGTTPTALSLLGGKNGQAYGINNAGQVVGYSYLTGNFAAHATFWNGTTPTDLGILPLPSGALPNPGASSQAYGINNVGQVVGWSNTTTLAIQHATLWNIGSNTVIDLGTLGGTISYANGINDAGQVVGTSTLSPGSSVQHATIWNGGAILDLNTLLIAAVLAGPLKQPSPTTPLDR
jgi:probable HAF family extracellular repeat protein